MPDEEFHIPIVRMEEEEQTEDEARRVQGFSRGIADPLTVEDSRVSSERMQELFATLMRERQAILADEKIRTKDKLRLLESNHRAILLLRGGRYKVFQSEYVVYSILAFSAFVLIALALLNVFAGLSTDVTLAFVGTTIGGTIATIAQKLGRI
jgi:hypothetical protein